MIKIARKFSFGRFRFSVHRTKKRGRKPSSKAKSKTKKSKAKQKKPKKISSFDAYIAEQKAYEKKHGKYSLHNRPR